MHDRKVLAFGAFDLLHPGHIFYLEKAKKLGTSLVVVIARDNNIVKEKGHEPVQDEKTRAELVGALKPVDSVILGYKEGDKLRVIDKVKPDVIALGHDQNIAKKEIQRYLRETNHKAKIVRLPAFKRRKYKSTIIRKKIDLGIHDLFE